MLAAKGKAALIEMSQSVPFDTQWLTNLLTS